MAAAPEANRRPAFVMGDDLRGLPAGDVMIINPLQHPADWDGLLAGHVRAGFFHTSAWARVLHETYGHTPFYFCRRRAGELPELLPVMEVDSPLTGRRGVSLPFTDVCPVLGGGGGHETDGLGQAVMEYGRTRGWKHLETRDGTRQRPGAVPSVTYYGHVLNLSRGMARLYVGLHDSVRRGIRKAERAGLMVERSCTMEAMRTFYSLHCGTRRRHGAPPQPFRFFENIVHHVLAAGRGCVFSVRQQSRVVAAAVFFHHGSEVLYKFGAFDYRFQAMRPNNLLMWEAIKWHANQGLTSMHFGRTSLSARGLRRFKLGFGTTEERLDYFRYNFARDRYVSAVDYAESWMSPLFRCLPAPALRWLGQLLYPHSS
jgi:hypothetical protein